MMVIENYLKRKVSIAPLAFFRVCFGLLILFGILRFAYNGWIESLYIQPRFFFSYFGFEFVKPLGTYTPWLFVLCGLSALSLALGLFYRLSAILLFLSFTYIELMDLSTYLNHYYFITLICFLMVFMPAAKAWSLDAWFKPESRKDLVPVWYTDALKLMVAILYVYAGLAKINSDWLLNAQPLRTWLPARNDMPIIGQWFNYPATAYIFSWMGCLYDLSIPFLLLNRKSRPYAYAAVVVFHLLTALLFPIGMFPHIMVVTALIFFDADFHQKVLNFFARRFFKQTPTVSINRVYRGHPWALRTLVLFFSFQLLFPFRYLLYPGELFWTEEGYRFSWRVMLMEKAGYAQFTVLDQKGNKQVVNNNDFLTPLQEKMMATQPDMMLQYAHLLKKHFEEKGFVNPEVHVDSYVALNGRLGRPLVNADIDLASQKESLKHKYWITPFNDEIKGF